MITIIAALTRRRVIGKDNKLPWHISDEIRNFKRLTTGNTVIMGRRTYESIGKPLPNRNNIVVSRSLRAVPGVTICADLDTALATANAYGKDIFIVGGARLYQEVLARADTMYLSFVKKDYEGDTYFPVFDEGDWVIAERTDYPDFEFVLYTRRKKDSPLG